MRTVIAAAAVVAAATGCADKPVPGGTAAPGPSAAPAPSLSVGAEVVAGTSEVAFRQGTVLALDAEKVTFEYGQPDPATGKKPTASVDLARAWPIGSAAKADRGDHLVCLLIRRKTELRAPNPTWYPCKVLDVRGGKLHVVDYLGLEYELDPEHAIVPDDTTRKAIAGYIETEHRHRAFDRGFEEAGRPARPPGWEPKAGDAIVIHWVGTSWYGGKVVELKRDKGKVRVDFEGERWDDRDVPLSEVAPIPVAALTVEVGQYALLRAKETDQRWEHVKVTRVTGDEVEVADREGKSHAVARKDLIPVLAQAAADADAGRGAP